MRGAGGEVFTFVVEDGCIFRHCVEYNRENRSWMSDLGALAHGRDVHAAPEAIDMKSQCLENIHPELRIEKTSPPCTPRSSFPWT